jgi:hypothetical protein
MHSVHIQGCEKWDSEVVEKNQVVKATWRASDTASWTKAWAATWAASSKEVLIYRLHTAKEFDSILSQGDALEIEC